MRAARVCGVGQWPEESVKREHISRVSSLRPQVDNDLLGEKKITKKVDCFACRRQNVGNSSQESNTGSAVV